MNYRSCTAVPVVFFNHDGRHESVLAPQSPKQTPGPDAASPSSSHMPQKFRARLLASSEGTKELARDRAGCPSDQDYFVRENKLAKAHESRSVTLAVCFLSPARCECSHDDDPNDSLFRSERCGQLNRFRSNLILGCGRTKGHLLDCGWPSLMRCSVSQKVLRFGDRPFALDITCVES